MNVHSINKENNNMDIIKKSETVNVRTIDEALEYIRTALKQGFKYTNINSYLPSIKGIDITIEKEGNYRLPIQQQEQTDAYSPHGVRQSK